MKTMSPALKAHIKAGSSTLATCWRIERPDKKVFCYTEHDKDITFNTEVYTAIGGFNKTAIKASGTFAVDNMDITGFLTDDTIPETEMRNGAFDYSEVNVFLVNYEDLSMGSVTLRYGYFGEVSSNPSGAFMVNLRGLVDMLSAKVGNVYIPDCRADLGDKKCGIKLIPPLRQRGKAYKAGARIRVPDATPPGYLVPFELAWFDDEVTSDLWPYSFNCQLQSAGLNLSPSQGEHYVQLSFNGKYPSKIITLLTDTHLTAAQIDSGLITVKFEYKYTAVEYGNEASAQILLQTTTGTPIKTETKNHGLAPVRKWVPGEVSVRLTPGTRRLRMAIGTQLADPNSINRIAYDDFTVSFSQEPIDGVDYRNYGGVEFECTQAGTSDNAYPDFYDHTVGFTTDDGTAKFLCVEPEWMFIETLSTDSATSTHVRLNDLDKPDEFFEWGVLKFMTGENTGYAIEIIDWNNTTKIMTTALPIPLKPKAGDIVQLQVGCDKTRKTCVTKFDNMINFRGHPDVPGQGQYFKIAGL